MSGPLADLRSGLAGAELLLDAGAVAERLARTLFRDAPAGLVVCPNYLRLKRATALYVAYEVRCAGEPAPITVHASLGAGGLVADERAKWETLHPTLLPRDRYLAFFPDEDLLFARLPFDVELRELPRLLDAARIKRTCEELADPFGDGRAVAVRERGSEARLLRFKPRRRAVVRWSLRAMGAEGSVRRDAITRHFAEPLRSGLAWRRALPNGPWPRLLSANESGTLLIEEQLPGDEPSALDFAAAGELLARFHRAASGGAAGATLHLAALRGAAAEGWRREVARAAVALEDLAALAPALAREANVALAALQQQAPLLALAPTVVHGDLHAGQFLRDEAGELRLCDLDRAEAGAPERDLARLAFDGCERSGLPLAAAAPLLSSYGAREVEAPTLESLAPWLAAAALQCASEPLRRFAADGGERAAARVAFARNVLARASGDASLDAIRVGAPR